MRIEFTVPGGGFMFKKLNLTMPDWQKNIIKIEKNAWNTGIVYVILSCVRVRTDKLRKNATA